jgi:hypothetical protein
MAAAAVFWFEVGWMIFCRQPAVLTLRMADDKNDRPHHFSNQDIAAQKPAYSPLERDGGRAICPHFCFG